MGMGKKPDGGELEAAPAKLAAGTGTRLEAQPTLPKQAQEEEERGISVPLKKSAAHRGVVAPPKKSLAIRLRLGGTGKKYASNKMKNSSQVSSASPLHRAARPVGSLSESRLTSLDSSEESEVDLPRSPLDPSDFTCMVRKPRSKMRRRPAKNLRDAARLIGVKRPLVRRKPLPSPKKKKPQQARDETDFLYILAEAGESLERACASTTTTTTTNAEAGPTLSNKPGKSAAEPSWKERAKQSEAAKEGRGAEQGGGGAPGDDAPKVREDQGREFEAKKGFKFRMKQKMKQNPTIGADGLSGEAATARGEPDAKPGGVEQQRGSPPSASVVSESAVPLKPDSKPTRQPSSGRPNGLVQRLLEKAGVQANEGKFRSGSGGMNGNALPQRRPPSTADLPTPSPRAAEERPASLFDEQSDVPLNVLAKLVDSNSSPKPPQEQDSPKREVQLQESPHQEDSPRWDPGTNTDPDSDEGESTEDEDNLGDARNDSGVDEHGMGVKRSRFRGSEGDAKRQRRIEANREAARQTIRRKRAHYEDMLSKEKELEQENSMLYVDIERARHDIEVLQNNISWLQSLLDKANEEDQEGRQRIQRSLRNEESRLEEQRCIMKARRAEELRRQEIEKNWMRGDKGRAYDEANGRHSSDARDGRQDRSAEDGEEQVSEGKHRMLGEERSGPLHGEDRRRPTGEAPRPANFHDLGPGGPGPSGWPMPRPGGPWMKGHGGMPPTSGPGSFPPEMAAMFAGGMPPGMMPPPGAFPGLPPGMIPPGMPTPEQMQLMSQAGAPPPWYNIPPSAMQQQHEMSAANEAARHAIASGSVPDMNGMIPHGLELPPNMRGMPPELAARIMAGLPPPPGMIPPYGMDPKQASRPPFFGKP